MRAEGDALHFRLLRCSTNLSGPTDDFRAADRHIAELERDKEWAEARIKTLEMAGR